MSAVFRDWDKGVSVRKECWRGQSMSSTGDVVRSGGRMQEVVCYRAGDEREDWILRKGSRSEDVQLAHLLP